MERLRHCLILGLALGLGAARALPAQTNAVASETGAANARVPSPTSRAEQLYQEALLDDPKLRRADMLSKGIRGSNLEVIDFALANGAKINDHPCLFEATQYANFRTMKRLVELGADPNKPGGRDGRQPPVLGLLYRGYGNIRWRDIQVAKIVEFLVKAGADVNARRTHDNGTILIAMIEEELTAAAERVIELGADVNLTNAQGETALAAAKRRREGAPCSAGIGNPDMAVLKIAMQAKYDRLIVRLEQKQHEQGRSP